MLVVDLTRWSEARETTDIKLQFSYEGQVQAPLILMSEDKGNCKPLLLQRWTHRYAWTSGLYFVFVWGSLLGLAVVILANFRIQNDLLRNFAVVGTCILWVAGLLGVPDLARVPVRSWIRRLFGATRSEAGGGLRSRRRPLTILLLAILCVVSTAAAQQVLWCYWVRQQYTTLIRRGMSTNEIDPAILKALERVPWRREAQILAEKSVWEGRSAGVNDALFRQIAARLAKPEVDAAIRNAPPRERLPFYLDGSSQALSNPLVWYASIIIEGENFRDKKLVNTAIDLLKRSNDLESEILRATLEITIEVNGDLQLQKVRELESRLESSIVTPTLTSTHTYLAACDMLVGYHLFYCETELASKWLRAELSAREHHRSGETLWLRPPDKFLVYYMFALYGSSKKGGVDLQSAGAKRAQRLIEKCGYEEAFKEISKSYAQFEDPEEWKRGTVQFQFNRLHDFLEDSLRIGWRY